MKNLMLSLALGLLAACGAHEAAAPPAAATAPEPAAVATAPQAVAAPAATPAGDASATDGGADAAAIDQSIDTVLGDHAAYHKLFDDLKAAVAKGDKAGVAALVSFPLEVTIGGKKQAINDAAAFQARYDDIMTPGVKEAIAAQDYAKLMVNAQGVMLGDGQVWLNGVCDDKACARSTPRVVTLQAGPN